MPTVAASAARVGARRGTPGRPGPAPSRRASSRPASSRPASAVARPARLVPTPIGLVDGLLRGRAWIVCVAGLLAGIVFFNVSLLELNGEIARTSERSAALKRQNADLRTGVARLGSSERIQEAARAQGFVLPRPGDVNYLRVDPTLDARRAAQAITEPGAVAFQPPPEPQSPAPRPAGASPPAPAPAQPAPATTTLPATGAPPAAAAPPHPSPAPAAAPAEAVGDAAAGPAAPGTAAPAEAPTPTAATAGGGAQPPPGGTG